MTTPSSSESVAIIGGGLVGALAALYLAKRGYSVCVYEKRPDLRQSSNDTERKSINLALSLRGVSALQNIGADSTILESIIPMSARMIHPKGGDLVAQPYGVHGEVNEEMLSLMFTGNQ